VIVLRFLQDRRGATAVEFALVAAPFMLLILGTIEYGRLIYLHHAVEETAIEGARCAGVVEPGCSANGAYDAMAARRHIVAQASGKGLAITTDDVTIDRSATCAGVEGFSRVTVAYDLQSPLPVEFRGTAAACFPNQ
jgi:Flp pilus assembly protein TadG